MLINWPQNNQGLQPLAYIFLVNQEWSALCQNIVCGRKGFVNTKMFSENSLYLRPVSENRGYWNFLTILLKIDR